MPARTGDTYTTPTGVVNTKKKTYAGKGPAPTGTKKVRPKTIDEVPVVTVTSSGVSAQNFAKPAAANRAVRKQERAQRRVRRVVSTQRKQEEVKARKAIPTVDRFVSSIADHAADAAEAISSAPKLVTRARNEAAVKAVEFPKQKTTEAFGKPTLGTPRVKQVVRAKKQGTLQVNKAGKVTIPETRQAVRKLRKAQKVYAKKAKPQISGLLNEEQERFAEALSKYTKLPPKLAGDWTLKESGASSAGAGGEAGEQNQLGVGYPAHPTSFSQSGYFNNTTPEKAAKATAEWMEGKIGSDYDYQAAPSIQEIPKLAKAGASDAELRAYIAGPSAWGTGEIPDSPQVTASPGKAGPKVTRQLRKAKADAKKLGIATKGQGPPPGPTPAKKLKGEWAGTKDILLKAAAGIPISSEKRTPEHNAAIGGSPSSDHLTTNTTTYATDLPTTDGVPIAEKVARRLGVSNWSAGNYDWYTTSKYPGYRFQILWAVEGHYDHVHVGSEWTGEDLPAGTIAGGSTGSSTSFVPSSGGSGGGSYSVPTPPKEVGIGNARKLTKRQQIKRNERKLESIQGKPTEQKSETNSGLADLERRYGRAVV